MRRRSLLRSGSTAAIRTPLGRALLATALLGTASPAFGGGPLLIGKDGVPRRWSTSDPVTINLDRGVLGGISNPLTLMQHAVDQWNGVALASLRVRIGDNLSSDVEGLNESQFRSFITRDDGTNPVIFDSTGAVFEKIYGAHSGVIGVAGPSLIRSSDGTIVKGYAMFNGQNAGDGTVELIKAAMTHELGHVLNLEHSQINGLRIGDAIPGFDGRATAADVETMFPVLVQTNLKPHPMATLHKDDVSAFSALYPASDFASQTGTVTGLVLNVDGATHLQGVNVIARNVDDPFGDAVSYVSGLLFDEGAASSVPALRGAYELHGLSPNQTYKVYIEEVASFFTGGSSVGPLDPPLDLDTTDSAAFLEFWNGASESADDPPDDPLDATSLRLTPGGTASRVDFIFNGVRPRVLSIDPTAGSYLRLTEVSITGANFVSQVSVLLRNDDRTVSLPGVSIKDPSSLTAKVPPGVVPAVYKVIVSSSRGESDLGKAEFTVTEPEPSVIGTQPDAVENDRPQEISVLGAHFLGARAARLARNGAPDVPLNLVRVITAGHIVVEVPAGLIPGGYSVIVTNTAGSGAPSAKQLFILELAPVLSGETDPPSAKNSKPKNVRVLGANLAGTTAVELVNGSVTVPVAILTTGLDQVTVSVPAGIEPGTYTVRITNTMGSATGPAMFIVKKPSGSGGGCTAGTSAEPEPIELLFLVTAVAAARVLASMRRRERRG